MSGAWYQGSFENLTVSINQSWSEADYTPYTLYNTETGAPFTAYARSAAAQSRPTRNLDTYDPERKREYDSFSFQFRARPGGGSQIFGGVSVERQRDAFCAANEQFHMALLDIAGNRWRTQIVTDLRKVMKLNRHHSLFKQGRLAESLQEHRALMVALEAHDAPAAARLMRAHFDNGLTAATAA